MCSRHPVHPGADRRCDRGSGRPARAAPRRLQRDSRGNEEGGEDLDSTGVHFRVHRHRSPRDRLSRVRRRASSASGEGHLRTVRTGPTARGPRSCWHTLWHSMQLFAFIINYKLQLKLRGTLL